MTVWDCGICTIMRICTIINPGSRGLQHSAPGASFVFIWLEPSFDIRHSGWSSTCLGWPWPGGGGVRTTTHHFCFLFQSKFLHYTCILLVCSQAFSPQSPRTWNFSVLFTFACLLGPSIHLGQRDAQWKPTRWMSRGARYAWMGILIILTWAMLEEPGHIQEEKKKYSFP